MVYDCILKGLHQPVLGHFSIDLDLFIRESRERMKKKLRKYASLLTEKNAIFSQLSNFIQKKEDQPKKSFSPNKDQGPKEIELSSDKDLGLKEPLLNIQAEKEGGFIIDLEVFYIRIFFINRIISFEISFIFFIKAR